MASGQDSRDPAYIPLFNFTKVEVRPGQTGEVQLTVTNRFAQPLYSVQFEFAFQVGGEWRHARPVATLANPPTLDNSSVGAPLDLAAGATTTVRRPFTTSTATPEGVYLLTLVVRFSYIDATNNTRGAVLKSLGAVAQEGEAGLVDMMNYSATLEALGIDGVAPDTSVVVDSHGGEALFWQLAVVGVVVVVAGLALSEFMARRAPSRGASRRKRG